MCTATSRQRAECTAEGLAADPALLGLLLRAGQFLQLVVEALHLGRRLCISRRCRVDRQTQRFPCRPLPLQGIDAAVAGGSYLVDRQEQLGQGAARALGGLRLLLHRLRGAARHCRADVVAGAGSLEVLQPGPGPTT